jgi:hypothetical protein
LPKGREASTQRFRWCLACRIFCRDDDIDGGQFMLRESERLANQAPRAIARDATARRFHGDGQTDARMTEAVGFDSQTEEPIVDSLSACIKHVELTLAAQTQFGAEAQSSRGGLHGRPRAMRVPFLRNDLLASLRPAARKNFLSARGLHSRAESGGAFALDLARLISAFHDDRPFRLISRKKGREGYEARMRVSTIPLRKEFENG